MYVSRLFRIRSSFRRLQVRPLRLSEKEFGGKPGLGDLPVAPFPVAGMDVVRLGERRLGVVGTVGVAVIGAYQHVVVDEPLVRLALGPSAHEPLAQGMVVVGNPFDLMPVLVDARLDDVEDEADLVLRVLVGLGGPGLRACR